MQFLFLSGWTVFWAVSSIYFIIFLNVNISDFRYFPICIGAVSGPYPYPIRIGMPILRLIAVSAHQSRQAIYYHHSPRSSRQINSRCISVSTAFSRNVSITVLWKKKHQKVIYNSAGSEALEDPFDLKILTSICVTVHTGASDEIETVCI